MKLISKSFSAQLRFSSMAFAFAAGVLAFGSAQAEGFDVEAAYNQSCAVCHNAGVAGAPRKGNPAAWAKRMEQGEDKMLASVKNGIGAMPAKGMCNDCTDDQFREIIRYMAK